MKLFQNFPVWFRVGSFISLTPFNNFFILKFYPTDFHYKRFPMVVGGVAGSAADLVYGYTVACLPERERYQLHRAQSAAVAAAAEAASSRSDSTPPPPTS